MYMYMHNKFAYIHTHIATLHVFTYVLNIIYYVYKAEKQSVCLPFLVEWSLAMDAWIGVNLSQNESYIFWHQQICFDKFLISLVSRPWCIELPGAEIFKKTLPTFL